VIRLNNQIRRNDSVVSFQEKKSSGNWYKVWQGKIQRLGEIDAMFLLLCLQGGAEAY